MLVAWLFLWGKVAIPILRAYLWLMQKQKRHRRNRAHKMNDSIVTWDTRGEYCEADEIAHELRKGHRVLITVETDEEHQDWELTAEGENLRWGVLGYEECEEYDDRDTIEYCCEQIANNQVQH